MFNDVYQDRHESWWFGTAEGRSESPGLCLAIAVKPYLDKTGWVTAFGVLLLGVLIYGGLRWWLNVLGARQHKLEEIIAERVVLIREREKQLQEHNEQLQQRLGERTRLLQNSEERYRELYTDNPTMYFTVDARGMVFSVNQFGAEYLGYTEAELVGQSVFKVFLEEDHLQVRQQLAECVQNLHQVHEFELRKIRKDGSILWVKEYARGVRNPGGEAHVLIVCEDVTAQKKTEAALKMSESQYLVLFDQAPTSLWELDLSQLKKLFNHWRKQGVEHLRAYVEQHPDAINQCLRLMDIQDVNQATLQLFQAASKDQLIANSQLLWNAEAKNILMEQLAALYEGRVDGEFETNTQTLRGKNINIWGQWHVVPEYERNLAKIFIATLDITERRKSLDEQQASGERLRALSAHLQSLREQERVAIARDLHDELGQALTSLKMDLSMLERKAETSDGKIDSAMILREIASMQLLVAATINKVRTLITELRPEVLDTLGLLPALEWQLEEFHKRTKLAREFRSNVEELSLTKDQAVAVFRIFQESLTNVARHAGATKVTATIDKQDDVLWVEIADDGKGIAPEALNAPGKFGLLGMRERAQVFGGEVSIIGTPGRGTTVKLRVPLHGECEKKE